MVIIFPFIKYGSPKHLPCQHEALRGIAQRAVFQPAGSRVTGTVDGIEDVLVVQLPLPQLVAAGMACGVEVGNVGKMIYDRGNNVPLGDLLVVDVVDDLDVGGIHLTDDVEGLGGGGEVVARVVDLDIQGGTCDYEIVDNVTYAACNPAIGGKYLNLTTLENIDTSKYYWNQGYNDMSSFTHDRIQYLASGSLAISMYRLAFMTLYNRTLFEEYQIEDLYKTVMDGKWTLDKQYALMKDHYYDKDGDGRVSQGDFFGFVTGDTISVDPYLVTSDIHMISQAPDTGNLIFNKEKEADDALARLREVAPDMAVGYVPPPGGKKPSFR